MRKISKLSVAAAVIAGVTVLGVGPATAQPAQTMRGGHGHGGCRTHNFNIDILGEVGILNGLAGNVLNGEGNPGAQFTDMGTDCDD